MPIPQTSRTTTLPGSLALGRAKAARWRHPFDSARGTVTLGVLLTIVLVVALRLLNG